MSLSFFLLKKEVKKIKKIITLAITVILLTLQILIPIDLVHAEQNIPDEEAYAIGAILTSTQGGEVRKDENYYEKMKQLGIDFVRNAYQNGKRYGDIVHRNGNKFSINPVSWLLAVGDTWEDFANTELTWIDNNRLVIIPGANSSFAVFGDRLIVDTRDYGYSESIHNYFNTISIYGRNLNNLTYGRLSSDGLFNIGSMSPMTNPTQNNFGVNSTSYGARIVYGNGTGISSISRIIYTTAEINPDTTLHIPTNQTPTRSEIESNFSSTFTESFDEETHEPINNNNWYTYDIIEINDENTIMNSSYITNNYIDNSTVIEQPDTIIHEPDPEGGGSFWRAVLSLLETLISSLANLGSSIANAIGMLFEPLFSLIGNIFDWLTWFDTDYMSSSFDTINTQFSGKFPDFSNIINTNQSIGTEPPDMTVNISFMGLGNQTVMNISPFRPYFPYIKNILRAFIWLSTVVIIFVKITGGGLND